MNTQHVMVKNFSTGGEWDRLHQVLGMLSDDDLSRIVYITRTQYLLPDRPEKYHYIRALEEACWDDLHSAYDYVTGRSLETYF